MSLDSTPCFFTLALLFVARPVLVVKSSQTVSFHSRFLQHTAQIAELQNDCNIQCWALTSCRLYMLKRYLVRTVCTAQLCSHLALNRLEKIMAPSALSPLTARGHPETCLVSVSIWFHLSMSDIWDEGLIYNNVAS